MPVSRLKVLMLAFIASLGAVQAPAQTQSGQADTYRGGGPVTTLPPGVELRPGALLQVDYRYFSESERADNRFDLRRARLSVQGRLGPSTRYRFEYEFQGNEARNLTDGYVEFNPRSQLAVRLGQFKEPFGLEWQTGTGDLFHAERSLAFSLGPGRDVGAMARATLFDEVLMLDGGVFNGDGSDGSSRGSESDSPEWAARGVVAPLRLVSGSRFGDLRLGASVTTADIDLANVNLEVKSTGMFGTARSLYVLNRNSKFGVLQAAGSRTRVGLEAAWALGPVAFQAEQVHLTYTDLETSGGERRDAELRSWYVSGLVLVTGERPSYSGGRLQPVVPRRPLSEGGWGTVGLALRLEHFEGDEDWIVENTFVSVAKANAWGAALVWLPETHLRLLVDYSCTTFSDPLRLRVNPDGSVDFADSERVLTGRLQFSF